MNLEISEMDSSSVEDVGCVDEYGQFTPCELQQPVATGPRKITYDDILSSLNMQVVNGKLQIVRNVAAENIKTNQEEPYQRQQQQQQQQQQPYQRQQQQQQQQPYQRQQQQQPYQRQQEDSIPLTKEQYKRMVAINYMRRLQQQRHIQQVKSTKLRYSVSNVQVSPGAFQPALNKLFALKGIHR